VVALAAGGAFAAFRMGSSPEARERVERRLEENLSRAGAARDPRTETQVDNYLRRFGSVPEARWFAAAAYLALDRPARAASTVWNRYEIRAQPGTPARFARLFLETWHRSAGADLRPRIALAEAGDAAAREALFAPALADREGALDLARELYRTRSPLLSDLEAALRSHADPAMRDAGAVISLRPGRPGDVPVLLGLVEDAGEGADGSPVLSRALLSLGATEDPRALARLREGLEAARRRDGDRSASVWWIALAAAGDAEAVAMVVAEGWLDDPSTSALAVDALVHRVGAGDEAADRTLLQSWRTGGTIGMARRLATAVLGLPDPVRKTSGLANAILSEADPRGDAVVSALVAAARYERDGREDPAALMDLFLDPAPGLSHSDGVQVRWVAARALVGGTDPQ
jgi:hypothetical protein